MNVVNSENHSTNFAVSPCGETSYSVSPCGETSFFNKFVVRLVQSATSDLKTVTPPSAHDLAMAYQAAFAARKAAV